ncbi:uncharacterized protein LOC124123827 [Haliotis rufescens]|uniref:uncharacterized protein LOC124123827 n=1 Tax=Haliotis rufescens TaxID=6454 RepID=UPI001EAFFB89|nr:uncharacterized protein LOC124123827 [Haliotis rufescens]
MLNPLACISLLVILACGVGAISLEECAAYDYASQCFQTYTRKEQAAVTLSQVCNAIKTYISCVENVACECNLTLSYNVASALTCIAEYYSYKDCEAYTGALELNKGIPCTKWGDTSSSSTEGELLVLSTAVSEYVVALNRNCSGYQTCYAVYDNDAALALHNRNLTQLCLVIDMALLCLENAACACNGSNDTNLINDIIYNDLQYRDTCFLVVGHDAIPRSQVKCTDQGTASVRTVCDTASPTYKCYLEFSAHLVRYGRGSDSQCPASKTYIECIENIACQCGLIRDWTVYQAITNAISFYNKTGCAIATREVEVVPGINCTDGSGTTDEDDRLIIALAEVPSVALLDSSCRGVKKCYSDLDAANGVALFQKSSRQLCANQKVFVECLEVMFCQCGQFDLDNTTTLLTSLQSNHKSACFSDSVLRVDFKCRYGYVGFNCTTDRDCQMVDNSECSSAAICGCRNNFSFNAKNQTCDTAKQVSGARATTDPTPMYGLVIFLLIRIFCT